MRLESRILVKGTIRFNTAFHIGSGEGGAAASDMGVLMDPGGRPILPGSSLKGVFRSTAEALSDHLGMTTCFLDKNQNDCAGGNQDLGKKKLKALDHASSEEIERILAEDLCDVCRLFGSSLAKGRLRFADATILEWAGVLDIRDGVGIDRDSGTAVPKVKYNYEVVPSGAAFRFALRGENLSDEQLALVYAVLIEWRRGFHIGGMTSRGFGGAELQNMRIDRVDFGDKGQRLDYLVDGKMVEVDAEAVKTTIRKVLEADNA
jgi:CRISPR-associated RAMP protein (TIGR02581 family)